MNKNGRPFSWRKPELFLVSSGAHKPALMSLSNLRMGRRQVDGFYNSFDHLEFGNEGSLPQFFCCDIVPADCSVVVL
jgi:hypothetical protein